MSPFLAQSSSKRVPSQYRVVIVDDDDDNLLFAQYAVESLGYKVIPIASGQAAIPAALAYRPDIILLDILLDGVNGIDIMHRLKGHRQLAKVPIIAVTALVQPYDQETYTAQGFADYLAKPYMLEDLATVISNHLLEPALQQMVTEQDSLTLHKPENHLLTG